MFYEGWSPEIQIAVSRMIWYNTKELVHALQYLKIFFSTDQLSIGDFNNPFDDLKQYTPCDQTTRFPIGETYVCQGHDSWGAHIDRIRLYTSIFLYDKTDRKYPDAATRSDARNFVLTLVADLIEKIEHRQLIDQKIFEEVYELEWIESNANERDIPVPAQRRGSGSNSK
ncbi:hypothetical protein BJV82DRAFT_573178 [Fennellomyces sp. T-0311]|nr:hypothetical protein BJV82DRAFT_573178 [Fennellomyces sp. T-0311]